MNIRGAVLITGTEVLSGATRDRNGPWISQRLGALGVEVEGIHQVGDRPEDLLATLEYLRARDIDLIVTSGGLGPTADDLTAEVVARFAGRPLHLDETMERTIAVILSELARRSGFDPEALRAANRKQAMVPDGATPIDPVGTAPGLVVPAGDQVVIVLPGPPRELQGMWDSAIAAAPAREMLARTEPYHELALRLFAMPESELAASLREIGTDTDLSALEITTCLRGGELEVDVRYRDGAEEAAAALRTGLVERHGPFVFSETGQSVTEVVGGLLDGRTIAVAESCTSGLLAARLTERAGSSAYFLGGVVAYSNAAKVELLGVPAELIARTGAVSTEVAEAMADGAIERFGADIGVGITGIAGPDGGTQGKPVGYVCVSAAARGGQRRTRDPVLPGGRADIRERSATVALHLVRNLLRDEHSPR